MLFYSQLAIDTDSADAIKVYAFKDEIFLEASFESESRQQVPCLSISSTNGSVSFSEECLKTKNNSTTRIDGVIGIVSYTSDCSVHCPILLTITDKKYVCSIPNFDGSTNQSSHEIYSICSVGAHDILPDNYSKLPFLQKVKYARFKDKITKYFSQGSFHFSYSYPLSMTSQNHFKSSRCISYHSKENNHENNFSFFSQFANPDLTWNFSLLDKFFPFTLLSSKFMLPIINGFVKHYSVECDLFPEKLNYYIVSRKGAVRTGPRYFCRGADEHGNVANFIETESIYTLNQKYYSFVQIRGSVPIAWTQEPTGRYAPPIVVNPDMNANKQRCAKHLDYLTENYPSPVFVNLIDSKKHEGRLKAAFEKCLTSLLTEAQYSDMYCFFDFHKECKAKGGWNGALNQLIDQLSSKINSRGCFVYDMKKKYNESAQNGYVRTNCIDCLDRTNVVQAAIAWYNMRCHVTEEDVKYNAFFNENENSVGINAFLQNKSLFNNLWADNADLCSLEYAGTPAMKTDFTRTGKRTHRGKLNDLTNSVTRYFYNNFADGEKTDMLLALSTKSNKSTRYSPFRSNTAPKMFGVLIFLLLRILIPVCYTFTKKKLSNGTVLGDALTLVLILIAAGATLSQVYYRFRRTLLSYPTRN